jgi:hypothetical protein
MVGGGPLVSQPDLLIQYTVTWGTTNRDNKTDAEDYTADLVIAALQERSMAVMRAAS